MVLKFQIGGLGIGIDDLNGPPANRINTVGKYLCIDGYFHL